MIEDNYNRPPLKVALVGLGRAMFSDHYEFFKAHPHLFRIVCASDPAKDRRDIVEKDFPACRLFRSYEDMLDEQDIDVIDIATPTCEHLLHAMESLKRGYWTVLESPITLTYDEAQILRGQVQKVGNKLIVMQRGLFEPGYLLAKQVLSTERLAAKLGVLHEIRIRQEDYVRRDDWQAVKRLGGGAAYYAMPDVVTQILSLLPTPPIQMWSELKRLASLGDAEDTAHVLFKTREQITADIGFSGGVLPPLREDAFVIRGDRGDFRVRPDAIEGTLTVIDPKFKFPRRRSSVRQPPLEDLHEEFPIKTETITLPPNTQYGLAVFWCAVYKTVRMARPFPYPVEAAIEAVKFAHLMKKTSPFGK